jgi:RecA/RadA recombinase
MNNIIHITGPRMSGKTQRALQIAGDRAFWVRGIAHNVNNPVEYLNAIAQMDIDVRIIVITQTEDVQ